ncbi:hypothetical protein B0T09DRAFT_329572 [Sordaria sp. MPI-SDFR-AT-0083]|nr:hypothetical protein B0T09DRAFT_329572 [Sordaria sp. MPI-SDFR-AT-0083]
MSFYNSGSGFSNANTGPGPQYNNNAAGTQHNHNYYGPSYSGTDQEPERLKREKEGQYTDSSPRLHHG